MKKIKKNDLRLEKEVISALTESDLGSVKGGINKPQTILNVDCLHPMSYDNKCQTIDLGASCAVSCGGNCMVKSVNIMCKLTEEVNCELKPLLSEGGVSVCYCPRP